MNKLSSTKTQLPYDYYSLPHCRPDKVVRSAENLGEVLRGDRIENSPYAARMRVDAGCAVLCRLPALSRADADAFASRVSDGYKVNMILDNLPVGMVLARKDDEGRAVKGYERGYPVGFLAAAGGGGGGGDDGKDDGGKDDDGDDDKAGKKRDKDGGKKKKKKKEEKKKEPRAYLHNHLRFTILYNRDPATDLSRVVGFEVEPFSVKHKYAGAWPSGGGGGGGGGAAPPALSTCSGDALTHALPPQPLEPGEEVVFTYDVRFVASDIRWAVRWDTYLRMVGGAGQIHWFSIVNSVMIVLFLSGMVAMILARTLRRDIAAYNALEAAAALEDGVLIGGGVGGVGGGGAGADETGWKLVHGDVLRPPPRAALLAALVGTGVQLIGMTVVTVVFAVLGFLSPANRGGLATAAVLLFVAMGALGGHAAGRLYKLCRGDAWKRMTAATALLFPGCLGAVFFALNLLVWSQRSSGAVPFGTLVALFALWLGVSAPLTFAGSYLGFRAPPPEDPVRTNKIPRQVPEQALLLHPVFAALVAGVLPFGAVFIELFFLLTSVWLHQYYYLFGFVALVFAILCLTCAEVTVVLAYFQLCAEDYRWWWRAYLTSGASALYLFAYSAFYFATKLEIAKAVPTVLYFSYMAAISAGFFCVTGTVGFLATLVFVRVIYSSLKLD